MPSCLFLSAVHSKKEPLKVEHCRTMHRRSNDCSGSISFIRTRRDTVLRDRTYRPDYQMTVLAKPSLSET
jgi:hypothetical protein